MKILPIIASLFAAFNGNIYSSAAAADHVPFLNVEVESSDIALDLRNPSTVRLLSDVIASDALRRHLEETSKEATDLHSKQVNVYSSAGYGAKERKRASTSFLSDIVVPAKFKSLLDKNVSPESFFSDRVSLKGHVSASVDLAVASQTSPSDNSGRRLQNGPECTPLDDGSVACVLLDAPFPDFFTIFFNCPASLTNVIECGSCEVLALDSTPDELTDNPSCSSCQVCPETSQVLIEFDCSNLGSGDCVSNDCAGNCFSEGDSTTTGTTPSSTGTLPSDCFETDQGNVGCALVNNPATDFGTVFTDCPSTLTSPRDCNTCVVLGPDSTTDTLLDNPTCTSCSVCATGQFQYQYDCANLITADCAIADCDGNCLSDSNASPTFSPPTSSGGIPTFSPPTSSGGIPTIPPILPGTKPPVVPTETSGGSPLFSALASSLVITFAVGGVALAM